LLHQILSAAALIFLTVVPAPGYGQNTGGSLGFSRPAGGEAAGFYDACIAGSARNCHALGRAFQDGKKGAMNAQFSALAAYMKACDGGHVVGCADVGYMHGRGLGVIQDFEQAEKYFKLACEKGSAVGCGNLGNYFVTGIGSTKDPVQGTMLLTDSCEKGRKWACKKLAEHRENGLIEKINALASSQVKQNSERITTNKRTDFAGFVDFSRPADVEAAGLYDACVAGKASDCNKLGEALFSGNSSVKSNKFAAAEAFKRSCGAGEAFGCHFLAYLYEKGYGSVADSSNVYDLYRYACDNGRPAACTDLGDLYLTGGQGKPKDPVRSAALLKEACDKGNQQGCNKLAEYQASGAIPQTDTLASSQPNISDRKKIYLKTESNIAQRGSVKSIEPKLQPSPGVKPPAVCAWDDPNCPPNYFILCSFNNREISRKLRIVYKCAAAETIFKNGKWRATPPGYNEDVYAACSRVFDVPISKMHEKVGGYLKYGSTGHSFSRMNAFVATPRNIGADPEALCKSQCASLAGEHRKAFCETP